MSKKTKKADDAALRTAMTVFAKKPTLALRANYKAALGKDPAGLSRDQMIKGLVSRSATEQPEPSQTPKAEQAAATRAETTDGERRRTGVRDSRLPAPGRILERTYKGKVHRCTVLRDGFGYERETYRSLTEVARKITGYKAISGPLFWGVAKRKGDESPTASRAAAPAKKSTKRARKAKKD